MTMEFLSAGARSPMPWKNGGGTTYEVAARREDEGGGLADFDWRISLADVAAHGPFSSFAGYDRIITLVRGPGMVLTVDGVGHRIDVPFQPFAFAGGSATDCRVLGGPLLDFNVMVRSGRVRACVDIVHLDGPVAVPVAVAESETVVVMDFQGRAMVRGTSRVELRPLDAVQLRAESEVSASSDATAVLAVVRLTDR